MRAGNSDVNVAIEMHPHNVVYNSATLLLLLEATGGTHVGDEMDPSHLFWQGIEPLGDRVSVAAVKDIRVNDDFCQINGVLDGRFTSLGTGDPIIGLGGRYVLNKCPENSSWQFVAVGRGHDVSYWAKFLAALESVNPGIAVNIEHEDFELGQREGLELAAKNIQAAAAMNR
jgi:sugar phosphate isomerase/epimerase